MIEKFDFLYVSFELFQIIRKFVVDVAFIENIRFDVLDVCLTAKQA